jgi:hypothetical protein
MSGAGSGQGGGREFEHAGVFALMQLGGHTELVVGVSRYILS